MMTLKATILLERQNGVSIVETIVRCKGIVTNPYLVVLILLVSPRMQRNLDHYLKPTCEHTG
jgi:hypothetical protein